MADVYEIGIRARTSWPKQRRVSLRKFPFKISSVRALQWFAYDRSLRGNIGRERVCFENGFSSHFQLESFPSPVVLYQRSSSRSSCRGILTVSRTKFDNQWSLPASGVRMLERESNHSQSDRSQPNRGLIRKGRSASNHRRASLAIIWSKSRATILSMETMGRRSFSSKKNYLIAFSWILYFFAPDDQEPVKTGEEDYTRQLCGLITPKNL